MIDLSFWPTQSNAIRPLVGEALLAAWERAGDQLPAERALTLLSAGFPELSPSDATTLSVAQRDLALLHLRIGSFGHALPGSCICGQCGERLEFTLSDDALIATLRDSAEMECTITRAGYTLRLRLANTGDIAAAATAPNLDMARAVLFDRCVSAVDAAANPISADALPEPVRTEALTRLSAMHDAAELSVSLNCPGCGTSETALFDIAEFLWAEVRHAAHILLDDVHELAWAYGWPESAILAMSAERRRAYLERLRA